MKILADRLRALRETLKISQVKMAPIVGLKQSTINRYENDQSTPSPETLLRYADYFDVSLDYIYGRTDKPQGKLYEYKPKIEESDPEMKKFIEMCFDPGSPINERLKETLVKMLKEAKQ
jgi:transcriptional regulator with XRE-family HTH domain